MTEPTITRSDFYVYALFRADGVTPFYIGKGRGNRIDIHERNARRFTAHKDRIIQAMHRAGISPIPKEILASGLTDVQAKQIEVDLIQLIGRWPTGPLANLTKGGDGVANLSAESRERQVTANIRSWRNPQVRAKRIEGLKRVWTPERRVTHKGSVSPEGRQRRIDALQRYWNRPRPPKEPKPKKDRIAMIRAMWQDPERRARTLAARAAWRATNPMSAKDKNDAAERLERTLKGNP